MADTEIGRVVAPDDQYQPERRGQSIAPFPGAFTDTVDSPVTPARADDSHRVRARPQDPVPPEVGRKKRRCATTVTKKKYDRTAFDAKVGGLDADALRKILWNLYWPAPAVLRERIEAALDPTTTRRMRRNCMKM